MMYGGSTPCCCMGPQNGDPVCPCMMVDYNQRQSDKNAAEILRLILSKKSSKKTK